MKLTVGELAPLVVKLTDGNTGMFPRALVYDATATLIATKDLTHIENGRYQNDTLVMPNTPYIVASYLVYSDAGHTTLSSSYGEGMDLWELDTGGPVDPTSIVNALMATVMDAAAPANAQTFKQYMNLIAAYCFGDADGLDGPAGSVYGIGQNPQLTQNPLVRLAFTVIAGVRRWTGRNGS